jgi:hypothetical protein
LAELVVRDLERTLTEQGRFLARTVAIPADH